MNNQIANTKQSARGNIMRNAFILLTVILTWSLFTGAAQASGDEYERSRGAGELYGVIEKMPANGYTGIWTINGREVVVSDSTRIKEKDGRAAVGRYVKVEGIQNGNSFTAYELEVEENREYRSDDRRDGSKVYGTVETLPQTGVEGIWRVSGREVIVNQNTRIKQEYGQVAVGSYVEVKGNYSGSTFTAYEIEVKNSRR